MKTVIRQIGEGWNPVARPPVLIVDTGLRRYDAEIVVDREKKIFWAVGACAALSALFLKFLNSKFISQACSEIPWNFELDKNDEKVLAVKNKKTAILQKSKYM